MFTTSLAYRRVRLVVACIALALGFVACAGSQQMEVTDEVLPVCKAALCNISQDTWQNHIKPRHCQGNCPPKSIFVNDYCGSRDDAIKFCQEIMSSQHCVGVQQPNGRVAYTATLEHDVGSDRDNSCKQTSTGTVIYDPRTRAVVTQFPGRP